MKHNRLPKHIKRRVHPISVFTTLNLKCVYRGQLDDARPQNEVPSTGNDIRAVLDAILEGKSVHTDQKPSIGCSIKWKL
jgi:hypothetical protein